MNKSELIRIISEEAGISLRKAELALNVILENIEETLQEGGKVKLVGFGTFEVRRRISRIGRNPSTGEEIKISAKNVVKFNPSSKLLEQGTGDGGPRSK